MRRKNQSPIALAAISGKASRVTRRSGGRDVLERTHVKRLCATCQGGRDSALAFLLLEKLGQKRVSVLPDSVHEWGFGGFPLDKETSATDSRKSPQSLVVVPTTYPVRLRPGIVTSDAHATQHVYPTVYIASGKSLPSKMPDGKVIHVPYTDLLNASGTPEAANETWDTLVKAGVPRYAEIISFSDDAGEAAANYFILKLMGFPDVKVLLM